MAQPVMNMPTFRGDDLQGFSEWASFKAKYPKELRKSVKGKSQIKFTVMADGSVADVEVISTPHEAYGAELKRVIESSPAWRPAKQNGKAVNVAMVVEIQHE